MSIRNWISSTTTAIDPNIFSAGNSTALDPKTIADLMKSISMKPTAEELKELEQLEDDYRRELKAAKLAPFKALPAVLRQRVIDKFLIHECFERMNSTQIGKTDRQRELENKRDIHSAYGGNYINSAGVNSASWNGYGYEPYPETEKPLPLPQGITIEDLQEAHLSKSLEEEIENET